MNKIIVTFDKSQEDIPTLVVAEDSYGFLNPNMIVRNIISGEKAVKLWKELTEKEQKGE